MIQSIVLVASGGAAGSVLRFLAQQGALRVFGAGFPQGTLAVNVLGSLAIGLCYALLTPGGAMARLIMTGLLGGFTTFSAFSLETLELWERGAAGLAALYILASVGLSLAAVALGVWAGRALA